METETTQTSPITKEDERKALAKIPTKYLVEELSKREAVQPILIKTYVDFQIFTDGRQIETEINEGCCHILIVWD